MAWDLVPLGECCDIVSGSTPKRKNPDYWNGDIAWATPKDLSALNSTVLADTPEFITESGYKSCSTKLLPKGAILFSSRAPIGLVAIAGKEMCTNQGFKNLVPGEDVDSLYLYYCMKWAAPQVANLGTGATFKEVNKKVVSEFKIPLPPLSEQERIAAILDKANSIRRKRQDALALADTFLRSVFLKMFGNPVTNPMVWKEKRFNNVVRKIVGGWSAKGEDRLPHADEKAVLKVSAVTYGVYRPSECKTVANIPENKKLVVPKVGDLLFSRANTRQLVAATCIVTDAKENVFLPDKLWRIDCDEELVLPEFVKYLFSHPRFREQLSQHATGTSGSMLNISKKKLLDLNIPVPAFEKQEAFAKLFWKMNDVNSKLIDGTRESNNVFFSLQQRAFRGDL